MLLFTSRRERNLWLWTLAVVVAIYSTLGLAWTLSGLLRDWGLLNGAFVLGFLLVLATILTQGLKTRLSGVELAVALGIVATYLMAFVRMALPEERTHLIEYGVVAVFIYEALSERQRNGRRVPTPYLLALLLTALLGWLDEGLQALLPNRVYDIRDVGFNILAGLMALVASLAVKRVRKWRG